METSKNELTETEDFAFKWQFGLLGGFNEVLAETIARADIKNFAKLHKVFPIETDAIYFYLNKPGWWQSVLKKVKSIDPEFFTKYWNENIKNGVPEGRNM